MSSDSNIFFFLCAPHFSQSTSVYFQQIYHLHLYIYSLYDRGYSQPMLFFATNTFLSCNHYHQLHRSTFKAIHTGLHRGDKVIWVNIYASNIFAFAVFSVVSQFETYCCLDSKKLRGLVYNNFLKPKIQ